MDATTIERRLARLGSLLHTQGHSVTVDMLGSAVLTWKFGCWTQSKDVDLRWDVHDDFFLRPLIEHIAQEEHLSPAWCNRDVGDIWFLEPVWGETHTVGGLHIRIPSAQWCLYHLALRLGESKPCEGPYPLGKAYSQFQALVAHYQWTPQEVLEHIAPHCAGGKVPALMSEWIDRALSPHLHKDCATMGRTQEFL